MVSLEVYSPLSTQAALDTQSQGADLSIKDVQSSVVSVSTSIGELNSRHRFLLLIAASFSVRLPVVDVGP
jgi:hypothetical protein